jgi:hypothetical protein
MHIRLCRILLLCLVSKLSFAQDDARAITSQVMRFTETLTPIQRKVALVGFDDTARPRWNNLPVGLRKRAGISIGALSDEQRKIIHRILSAGLSSQGYLKATSIMHLDNLLNMYYDTLYQRKEVPDSIYQFVRDLKWSHQNFYFVVFGNPGYDATWGCKLEGHHLSLNLTFDQGKLAVTPFFIGTDPAEYPIMEYAGWRVLAMEEDYGMALMKSLDASQKKIAIKSGEVPGDIITAAESGKRLVDYWGIKGTELSAKQKSVLAKIIREFVFNFEYDRAKLEYSKIEKAGMENIYFGWIGSGNEFEPHYYILNGPTFLIEFDNNGGPRKSANHIHAIWREKGNEYGEDLLKQHYLQEHKKK